jgi:hypothetical protein
MKRRRPSDDISESLEAARKARREAIVEELRDGIRQRSKQIPSGKVYKRRNRSNDAD